MANREKGEVALTVGGRDYTLVLNTNAMAAIEDHLSTPSQDVTWDAFWKRVMRGSVRAVTVLLWGMCRKYHPEVTVDQVGEFVDELGGLPGLEQVLVSANVSSTPDPADVKDLRPKGGQTARPRRARDTTGSGGDSTAVPAPLA